MDSQKLLIKLLSDSAVVPEAATSGSAGIDLRASIPAPLTVAPGDTELIPTGIAIALPDNAHVALIFARSGLSIRHGLALANGVGVIDSDYRGEICVGIINQSKTSYTIEPGERVAQLVVMPVSRLSPEICDELPDSVRGNGGFGSTGRA